MLAQSGEDSSGEEEGDSLDELEEDEHEDDSEVDSEEEEWPVGPLGSVGVNGWRRAGKG